jgi:jasmonic acid-amino synthetase
LYREFPIQNGKVLSFIYSSKSSQTKGGVTAATATANVFKNPGYKHAMEALKSPSVSPDEVIFSPDFHQTLYCHLLCGLLFREEVQLVSSTFAYSIVYAFRTFEQVFDELVTDIKEGVLSSRITHQSIRTAMSTLLKMT